MRLLFNLIIYSTLSLYYKILGFSFSELVFLWNLSKRQYFLLSVTGWISLGDWSLWFKTYTQEKISAVFSMETLYNIQPFRIVHNQLFLYRLHLHQYLLILYPSSNTYHLQQITKDDYFKMKEEWIPPQTKKILESLPFSFEVCIYIHCRQ